MTHWILFASMLMMLGSMSRVAGAPRILDTLPSVSSIQRSGSSINSNQHPKEELELESLKGKGQAQMGSGNGQKPSAGVEIGNQNLPKISSSGTGTGTERPTSVQNPPKAAVNMEHPTQSDNDNENSDKFLPKSLEMEGSGLFLDEKRKPTFSTGKSDGMHTELDYTPQDVAEYIFWTGDERGVALALNDFLQDELVTKEDVIRFLEDVKVELNLLRNRYSTVTQVNPILQNFPTFPLDQSAKSRIFSEKPKYVNEMPVKKESLSRDYSSLLGNYDGWTGTGTESESQKYGNSNLNGNNGLSPQTQSQILSSMIMAASPDKTLQTSVSSGEELPDYEDMIEKIRQADAKLREYSLEEIIYQLAKELFAQELQEQPKRSIQRFAHFVENEAALGHIPKDLSKAVLDTLVGALVDAVNEQPPGTLKQLDSQIPNQIPNQNQPSKSKSINDQIKQKFQSTKNKIKK